MMSPDQAEGAVYDVLNKNKRFYVATPETAAAYAGMKPDFDSQK